MKPRHASLPSPVFRISVTAALATLAALLSLAPLAGCAGPRYGGSGLSEAADAARVRSGDRASRTRKDEDKDHDSGKERDSGRDKDRKKRRDETRDRDDRVLRAGIPVRERHPRTVVIVDDYCCDEPGEEVAAYEEPEPPSDDPGEFYAGFSVGGFLAGSTQLGNGGRASIRFGGILPETERRMGVEVEGGLAWSQFEGPLGASFDNPWELSLAGAVRYYVSPWRGPANVYVLGGLRGALFRWDYRTPVSIEDEYGDVTTARNDWIATWAPFVGVGVTLLQSEGFELGVQVSGGARFYDTYTVRGLRNDLFDPEMFAEVRFDLSHAVR